MSVIPSPNIWNHPDIYEIENRAVDPHGRLEAAMASLRPTDGATVLDIGCGTGFHLPRFAATARRVIGVEPHPRLAELASRRAAGLAGVAVRRGTAEALPLPDSSVDVAHARWAYFFGPGCEPGLDELRRVLRRGGAAFIIDNDSTRSTFGSWFRRAFPRYDPAAIERFWSAQGFTRRSIDMGWQFTRREDLEACVRIEFAPSLAAEIIAEHDGLEVDYAVNLWHRFY